MEKEARVAIILPVHNSMPHLKPMVENLYHSTNFPFKLIIVESESTDGTKEYVDSLQYDNLEVYHTPKRGLTPAINFGIKKAEELDVYITQDDVIHFRLYGRDWLLEMHDHAQRDKKVGIMTGHLGGGISGPEYIKGLRWAGTWNTYIPRRIINDVGLFDENMGPGDDIDYCYRIAKKGYGGAIIDFWVQHHRLTEHGNVDQSETIAKMAKYFRKKHKLGEFKDEETSSTD